jgi:hypothetical protein
LRSVQRIWQAHDLQPRQAAADGGYARRAAWPEFAVCGERAGFVV